MILTRQQISEFEADCKDNVRYKDESTGVAITGNTLLNNVDLNFEDSYNTLMESLIAGNLFVAEKSAAGSGKDFGNGKRSRQRVGEKPGLDKPDLQT